MFALCCWLNSHSTVRTGSKGGMHLAMKVAVGCGDWPTDELFHTLGGAVSLTSNLSKATTAISSESGHYASQLCLCSLGLKSHDKKLMTLGW